MKTLLLSFLFAAGLQSINAQQELASADGIPPHFSNSEPAMSAEVKEPAIAAFSHTVNDAAIISLGKGFRDAVNLQVITPSADILINEKIPAGQQRVKIDLAGMEDGTYTVRIKLADKTWVKQVVKKS